MRPVAVYLDMDGVLADFDAGLAGIGLRVPDGLVLNRSSSVMTAEERALKAQLYDAIRGTRFFLDLPLMSDAMELWESVAHLDPVILTAVPQLDGKGVLDGPHFAEAARQKLAWIRERLDPAFPEERFVAAISKLKKQSIGMVPGRVQALVDDRRENVQAWEDAGGLGILHRSASESMRLLRQAVPSLSEIPESSRLASAAP